jgi:hypothetical protein
MGSLSVASIPRETAPAAGQRHPLRPPPVQDRLHHFRREQRQPQHPRDIGRVDLLCRRQLGDGRVPARFDHSAPAKGPRQGIDQGGVHICWPLDRVALRRRYQLSPTGQLPGRQRHSVVSICASPVMLRPSPSPCRGRPIPAPGWPARPASSAHPCHQAQGPSRARRRCCGVKARVG